MRLVLFLPFFLIPFLSKAQKLHLGKGERHTLAEHEISIDTLILEDSAAIVLQAGAGRYTIRTRLAILGKQCAIIGRGKHGIAGGKGQPGRTPIGPCKSGSSAKNGSRGEDGTSGVNLLIYIDTAVVNGSLIIDLAGGNGGDGGDGGEGGDGSPGTVHCQGGDGGKGGDAGNGGDGGNGGNLTIAGNAADYIHFILGTRILVNTLGGNFGYAGMTGNGGAAGLGPREHGVNGKSGRRGSHGKAGTNGAIQFETIN